MSYEYKIEIVDEPLTWKYIQNEYGVDGFRLITILEYDNKLYYHFERS